MIQMAELCAYEQMMGLGAARKRRPRKPRPVRGAKPGRRVRGKPGRPAKQPSLAQQRREAALLAKQKAQLAKTKPAADRMKQAWNKAAVKLVKLDDTIKAMGAKAKARGVRLKVKPLSKGAATVVSKVRNKLSRRKLSGLFGLAAEFVSTDPNLMPSDTTGVYEDPDSLEPTKPIYVDSQGNVPPPVDVGAGLVDTALLQGSTQQVGQALGIQLPEAPKGCQRKANSPRCLLFAALSYSLQMMAVMQQEMMAMQAAQMELIGRLTEIVAQLSASGQAPSVDPNLTQSIIDPNLIPQQLLPGFQNNPYAQQGFPGDPYGQGFMPQQIPGMVSSMPQGGDFVGTPDVGGGDGGGDIGLPSDFVPAGPVGPFPTIDDSTPAGQAAVAAATANMDTEFEEEGAWYDDSPVSDSQPTSTAVSRRRRPRPAPTAATSDDVPPEAPAESADEDSMAVEEVTGVSEGELLGPEDAGQFEAFDEDSGWEEGEDGGLMGLSADATTTVQTPTDYRKETISWIDALLPRAAQIQNIVKPQRPQSAGAAWDTTSKWLIGGGVVLLGVVWWMKSRR